MNHREAVPVLAMWYGTIAAFTLDTVSVWVSLLAGILTLIYTSLKILDWIECRLDKSKCKPKSS